MPFQQTVNLSNGLTLNEAEAAITAIAAIHSLTLGMKLKEKVDLNEKYPVSIQYHRTICVIALASLIINEFVLQFLFQIAKATDSYQQLVEQGFPQLVNFLKGVNGFSNELAALEVIRLKTKAIIEKLLQPIEPMGLITHTDFWCNNLLLKQQQSETDDDSNKSVDCVILDWQMITYSRYVWCMYYMKKIIKQNLIEFSFFLFMGIVACVCVEFFHKKANQ